MKINSPWEISVKALEKLSAQIDQCLALAAGDEMLTMLLSMASLEASRRIETMSIKRKAASSGGISPMGATRLVVARG